MKKQIFEIVNFFPDDYCDLLTEWLSLEKLMPKNGANSSFDGKTICYTGIKVEFIKQIVMSFKYMATSKVQELTGNNKLFPDFTDLVKWKSGETMPVHHDNVDYCSYREYSGVLYLNDDYEGGETFFPDLNYEIIPEKGKLALFPSDNTFMHGVRYIKGNRYTLPIWFTTKLEKIET